MFLLWISGTKKEDCFKKDYKCKICDKVGHLARVCRNCDDKNKDPLEKKGQEKEEDNDDEADFVGMLLNEK